MAMAMTRGAAAPKPCTVRAPSSSRKLEESDATSDPSDEHGEPQHQHGLAAVAIGKPPIGELPDGKAKDIADDDDLPVVGV